jgi:CheY-like chemotaxis protein
VKDYVLLVDDDPEIRTGLSHSLDVRGIVTRTATTGEAALEAAQADPPALVFLDFHLPGMEGPEVAARLHELGIAAPAVLMSATVFDLPERAHQLGFAAALAKPFRMADVYALVDRLTA